MKQAIIALSMAIISSSVIANPTTTVPKSNRDSGGDITFDNAAKQDPVLHRITIGDDRIVQNTRLDPGKNHLDFNAVEGFSAPIDVPIYGDDLGRTAHISTSADSAAQVIENLNSYSMHCQELHYVLAVDGDVQITFPENITAASLLYEADGHESKFAANPTFSLSIVLLDADGNLVRSETVVGDPSIGTDWNALQIMSTVPFQKIVLTPSNDQVWFISKAEVEPVKQEVPDEQSTNRHMSKVHVKNTEILSDAEALVPPRGDSISDDVVSNPDALMPSSYIPIKKEGVAATSAISDHRPRLNRANVQDPNIQNTRTPSVRINVPNKVHLPEGVTDVPVSSGSGLLKAENEIDAPIRSGSGLATPESIAEGSILSGSGL